MKKLIVAFAAALCVASVVAADGGQAKKSRAPRDCENACGREGRQGVRAGEGRLPGAGPWVAQILASGGNLEKIGVEDEELCKKLQSELKALRKKNLEAEKKIREVSREQAKMMRTFLKDKSCSAEDIYAKIDEVARLRAEQGRLAVQSMELLRDNLTQEQIKAAQRLIMEGARKRGRMRRGGDEGRPSVEGGKRRPVGDEEPDSPRKRRSMKKRRVQDGFEDAPPPPPEKRDDERDEDVLD